VKYPYQNANGKDCLERAEDRFVHREGVDSGEKRFRLAPKEKQNQHIAAGQPVAREREIG
jgi:uncharacterized protein YheU (UPF0270 family)